MTETVRLEWGLYDLRAPSGITVEVKSSAYVQTWHQDTFSRVSFDIAPKTGWDPWTNRYHTHKKRHADVYVFCLLAHKDQDTIDPLDLDQWQFYVLATSVLNRRCPTQKTIGLAPLRRLGPVETSCAGLAAAVEHAVGRSV